MFTSTGVSFTSLSPVYNIHFHVCQMRWWIWIRWNYPLRAETQRLHQAGLSLSEEGGGGGGGAGGAGGELSRAGRRGGRGDGQRHGAGLLLHPLDATQPHISTWYTSTVIGKWLYLLMYLFSIVFCQCVCVFFIIIHLYILNWIYWIFALIEF